jgi:hypothetical protein
MGDSGPGGAGVGGWLALFVVIVAVVAPIASAALTAAALYGDPSLRFAYAGGWTAIQALEWSLVALAAMGCWYIAWRLVKVRSWSTVRLTIAGIWLLAWGPIAAEFLGIALIAGIPIGALLDGAGREAVRPLVFSIIWTAYFLRSRRVADTYVRGGGGAGEGEARVFT